MSINHCKENRLGAVFGIILPACFAVIALFPMRRRQQFLGVCSGACLCLMGLIWVVWPSNALAQAAPMISPAAALPEPTGASLFSLNCAGCHAHGGNIVRRGKNLKQKTLIRNGYAEPQAIATLITQGKGAMPAYADRLTAEEIEAIATYVLQQSKSGW